MGVITKKQQARLVRERRAFKPRKRKVFNPEWDDPNDIAHPLDDDIVQTLRKQEKCTDLIDLFSQDLDPHVGEFHFRWSDEDIRQLWFGIIERSLKLLRDVAPNTDDHNTEWIWWFSLQAKYVCACVGFDHSIFLRELIGRFGIPSESELLAAGWNGVVPLYWDLPLSMQAVSTGSGLVYPDHDCY